MITIPGKLTEYPVYYDKLPDQEYDEKGIPYGIQPDYDRPYQDTCGNIRYAYVYRPASLEPMLLTGSLIVVTEETTAESITDVMVSSGLLELAEREKIFLIFPTASEQGWNIEKDPQSPDDVDILNYIQYAAENWFLFPGREKCHGYLMGMVACNRGATMAEIALSYHPEHVHSALFFRSEARCEEMSRDFSDSEMCVWEVGPGGDAAKFWINADGLNGSEWKYLGNSKTLSDKDNRARQVFITEECSSEKIESGILMRFWIEACSGNARIPDSGRGKVFSFAEEIEKKRPCIHINDRSIGDNGFLAHNWVEFIPKTVLEHSSDPEYRCPLIIEMHGGGSWPKTSMVKVQFQNLGEEKGFITVYANASAVNSWNSIFRDDRPSDADYIAGLIEYLCERYPVDRTRVYVSGFSNGSGMAHVMAAIRPDLIAGAIVFNTRYPVKDNIYDLAENTKKKKDYRVPVFSTYGTKDAEYPMKAGCGQFTQMDFWKWYNNIERKPLTEEDSSGIGAEGDRIIRWGPPDKKGKPVYTTHEFITKDEGHLNLYNYTLIDGLPHTVDRGVIRAAWDYISQFSRTENGELVFEKGDSII